MEVRPSQLLPVTPANPTHPQTRHRPGQFVSGNVLKWLGNGQASVSINGQTLVANLENTLQTGVRYSFQVVKEEANGTLHLKVMNSQPVSGESPVSGILRQMGIPVTPQSSALLTQMMEHNWPIVPSFVKQALKLTNGTPNAQEAFSVLEDMVARDFPLSPSVFKAIQTAKFGPSAHVLLFQLEETLQTLEGETTKQEATTQTKTLKNALASLQNSGGDVPSLPQLLEKMGFFHEAMVAKWSSDQSGDLSVPNRTPLSGRDPAHDQAGTPSVDQKAPSIQSKSIRLSSEEWTAIKQAMTNEQKEVLDSLGILTESGPAAKRTPSDDVQNLKSVLLSFLNTSHKGEGQPVSDLSHVAEQLVHQITGQQLLSLTHDPEWLSLNVQIPIFNQGQPSEARVKWEIKKTPEGAFDPEFCRLVFHVNLTHLKETVLQMVIQNRALTCTLYTEESPSIEFVSSQTVSEMKDRLRALNYELISFQHRKEPVQDIVSKLFHQTTQMDVSI